MLAATQEREQARWAWWRAALETLAVGRLAAALAYAAAAILGTGPEQTARRGA